MGLRLREIIDAYLGNKPEHDALPAQGQAYRARRILVTGAGGTVGSELCGQLIAAGPACLVLFDQSEIALYEIQRRLEQPAADAGVEIISILGSVTDSRLVRAVLADHRIEIVLHAAAYKHVPLVELAPLSGLANNVLGTRIVAEAAHEAGVLKFVFVSTDKAVHPTNIMGASKRLAELVVQDLAKRSTTAFSIVRFGNVFGSSGSVVPLFRAQILGGGPVTLTHRDVTRYFMTIAEAAHLVLRAGDIGDDTSACDIFVLDMGQPVKIHDLALQMMAAMGVTPKTDDTLSGQIEIVVTGLRPGEKLHEAPLIWGELQAMPHPKIFRTKEPGLSELETAAALRDLRLAITHGSAEMARDVVRTYVTDDPDDDRAISPMAARQ